MIFIIGTQLTEDQLPSFTEYRLFADSDAMGAKVALKIATDLTTAYINKKFEGSFVPGALIPESVYKKFVFFKNDEELLKILNGDSDVESDTLLDNISDGVDEDKVDISDNGLSDKNNVEVRSSEPVTSEVNTDEDIIFLGNSSLDKVRDINDEDDFDIETFKIPTSSTGNYDAVAAKLEAKEKQLEQFKALMTEKVAEYEEIIKELDAERGNIIEQFDKKIKEAQEAFTKAQATINSLTNTTGKYHTYAERPKIMLSEVFEPSVSDAIKGLGLNITVMFAEGGVADMQYLISQSIDKFRENYVYIDLTGESYFDIMYKSKLGDALKLFDEMSDNDIEVFKSKIVHRENADIIAEYLFHDIMFLDADWLRFFTNVKRLFGDRKIILMLGSVASFPVSYTISRLAPLFTTYLHFKCSFTAIKSAFNYLKFFPNGRNIKVVATFLFDEASSAINKLGEKYAVITSPDILSLETINKR